ncbi:MAG TPA: TrmH family RNA methyltransferase [Gemmatimonadaceae bacterium]|nr:TrmH family RNA methyltransferase [Gemmatimonadaceae bacterium]
MASSILDRVRVVLYEPQNPINIAATVRAMKNFGIRDLRLVRPVPYDPYRLEGIAHDTHDIIAGIVTAETLDEAVADCTYVAAFTARHRSAKWALTDARGAAERALEQARDGTVALLFGREDFGLPNEALDRAHLTVTIPTTNHASLNLAQAVIVALYELHLVAGDATRALPPPRKDAPPASKEMLERYFSEAEATLERIQFFKTRYREHIMRTLRSLTMRAQPDAREITLMRAMALEVIRAMDRELKQQRAELAGAQTRDVDVKEP